MRLHNIFITLLITMGLLAGCGEEKIEKKELTKENTGQMSLTKKDSQNKGSLSANTNLNRRKAERASDKKTAEKPPANNKLITKGEAARPLEGKTQDGQSINLKDYKGKYVLLDFWASWCPPCRKEIPYLKQLHDLHGKKENFAIIGISLDRSEQNWREFMKENKMDWSNILDTEQTGIATQYGVRAIPFTAFIDPTGKVIATQLRGKAMVKEVNGRLGS